MYYDIIEEYGYNTAWELHQNGSVEEVLEVSKEISKRSLEDGIITEEIYESAINHMENTYAEYLATV